jgi:hypothetical protein
MKRIETLSHPGAKEAGESHTGVRALGTASATTDFACNDQRANTALGQIVVRRNSRNGHKDKEFRQKVLDTLAEGLHRSGGLDIGSTNLPQLLLKGMLLRHASAW